MPTALSRRKFLGLSAAVVAAGAMGTLGKSLYEPHEITVSQLRIALKRLPLALDGIRIAQLSDIHFNPFMSVAHLERVIALTNAQKPDIVVLTGDFVTVSPRANRKASAEHAWPCADVLRRLEAPLGCLAVLGNHDYDADAEIVREALSANGHIQVLRNQSHAIEKDGARIWIAGIDNVTKGNPRPAEALRGVPRKECTVVAVHEPDFADQMRKFPVDFQISGHSHGGQIRFPIVGAVYLPPLARKYPMGHYQLGEMQLYTNRGIGVIELPMRFLCPPEISIYTLKTAVG